MKFSIGVFFFFLLFSKSISSYAQVRDSIYLMNGNVIGEEVVDTLLGAITINDSKKPGKRIHYEYDQLYMIKYSNGANRYYYYQDSLQNNWFTREEMWYFTKGEKDSRKYFKPKGCAIGAGIVGLIGGMSGTFWGPILPYGYMAFSGITRIKIRQRTVSNPKYVDYDPYILGYERTARQKRKIWSVLSGTVGLATGYGFYALFHNKYPENVTINFLKIKI